MNRRRPLDASELADAAMSAAVVMALLTTGRLVAAGVFFQVLGTLVMTGLAARQRGRVVATATVAAMGMAVLLGGIGPIGNACVAGIMGWANGVAIRREYGLLRHVTRCLAIAWPPVVGATLLFLVIFAEIRDLTLENMANQWDGLIRIVDWVGIDIAGSRDNVAWALDHWYVGIPIVQVFVTIGYALIVRRLGRFIVQRVDAVLGTASSYTLTAPADAAPLPVQLTTVTVERGPVGIDIGQLDATIEAGSLIALSGANGAGKTSLIDGIAGLAPSTGIRPHGPVGLGAHDGTALISQQPDTQVLGVSVTDDLRWGTSDTIDVASLLDRVGLAGRADQPTAQLSGGELQRLAIAAAIARNARLVLSDESTAMLDPDGRATVMGLLRAVADRGAAVVHSTHLPGDIAATDSTIAVGPPAADAHHVWSSVKPAQRPPLLVASGVGYVHNNGTPWAYRALDDINLHVPEGGLLVVRGTNGSGKTTLARLLSGLILPTEGTISLQGKQLHGPHRSIGIAFQHARLQLMRPTLAKEVQSLSGVDDVAAALRFVGFDPEVDGDRAIDHLSGGEQRRALIAGVVARKCDVVILDEPLAGLDADGRARLTASIDQLLDQKVGVVVISHDPAWALDRADDVFDLDAHALAAATL